MKFGENLKHGLISLALSGILIPMGCGKAGNSTTTLPPAASTIGGTTSSNCPAGQISSGGQCVAIGDATQFLNLCTYGYGTWTTIGGVKVCRAEFAVNYQIGRAHV